MPDVLDKSGKVVGRYDYTPEGRKRAKAHADKIGGTVKKKFTDTHPHGMYSTTRSTGLKTIKPEKKKVYKKILKKTEPEIRPKKSTLTKETTLIGKAKPKEEKSGFWHPKGHIERGSGSWGYLKKGRKEYPLKKRKKTAKKKKTTKTLAPRPTLPR